MKKRCNKKTYSDTAVGQENYVNMTGKIDLSKQEEEIKRKPTLLLHSCCGPCSTAVVERLINDYDVTVFFYNPNITDRDEYLKRLETQRDFIEKYNLNPNRVSRLFFREGPYDSDKFYQAVGGYESEAEGGQRCAICIRQRLEKTAGDAMILGFDFFSTTLSVSPHKSFELISKIGNDLAMRSNLPFLAENYRKSDGFKRSIELSKRYGLYRQNYCGCEFSK